jgi:hypothetical protein
MTTPDLQDPLAHLVSLSKNGFNSDQEEEGSLEFADGTSEVTETDKESKPGEEADWKTRFEESEARFKSLEQKQKTQEGRTRVRESREKEIATLQTEMAGISKMVSAFVSAQAPDSTLDLGQEIGKIQNEQTRERATNILEAQYQRISEALAHSVHDDEDNLLLTKEQVEQVRGKWQDGLKSLKESGYRDFNGLTEVVLSASKLVVSNERATLKATSKKSREEEATAKKAEEEETGVGELDTGPASGRSSVLDDLSPLDLMKKGLASNSRSKLFD